MIESLDEEASRVGVTRQSIIKVWLAERLENLVASKALQWNKTAESSVQNSITGVNGISG